MRGSLGFGAVSLVAYGVWAFAGKPLSRSLGEGGFYAVLVGVLQISFGLRLRRFREDVKATAQTATSTSV